MPAKGNWAYRLYQSVWLGLDWLYPPRCGGCGEPGARWCSICQEKTQIISPPICPLCGQPQRDSNLCAVCQTTPHSFVALRSWAVFNGQLRNALHRLKYRRDVAMGEALARPLIPCLENLQWAIDVVIPVPLGLARLAERGYNQSALLARPLALGSNLDFQPHALRRARDTRSQVGLSAKSRRENVAGAFHALPEAVAGKNVLIVDDVATSGATLDACADALLSAGACRVYGLTLARAVRKSSSDGRLT